MKTIIFIETNKSGSSREAIKAAEAMGYYTVLFTSRRKFISRRSDFPDVHRMIYTPSFQIDVMRKRIKNLHGYGLTFHAIVSFIDPNVYTAALLSNEFCTSRISTSSIQIMEDKIQTRKELKDNPASPTFYIYDDNSMNLNKFIEKHTPELPLIIKAPNSTGSKDVYLVEDKQQFKNGIETLLAKYPGEPILIEEYLNGPQYLIEVAVYQSKSFIVGVFRQDIETQPPFIVRGYSYLAKMNKGFERKLTAAVHSLIKDLKVKNGTLHLEMRLCNDAWKLIEINPRVSGGAMNKIIEVATGINLAKETLNIYLGKQPNLTKKFNRFVHAHYLTINKKGYLNKVTGKSKAAKQTNIHHVYVKPRKGQLVRPPKSMGHRYAYVIASGTGVDEAKYYAENAARQIEFFIDELK